MEIMILATGRRVVAPRDRKIERIQVPVEDQAMTEIMVKRQTMVILIRKGGTIEIMITITNKIVIKKVETETEMIDTDMIIATDTALGIPDR